MAYFSDTIKQEIHSDFQKAKALAKGREEELFSVLEEANEEERICLEFLFAYMPISDLAFYEGEIFLKSVRASLKARDTLPWGKDLDPTYFLNYVLALRLNNEELTDHRALLYDTLVDRVKDLSMKEAALEVNYWCFEKATYQSTDYRTISPLTIMKTAFGRCGEESVFLVSALRSLAIPARQVYTPRWAHCDDNHAWVEVYVDGKWQFLGACEPEPVLNAGWFTNSARRGMLLRARNFSKLVSDEIVMPAESCMTQINCTENYAPAKTITVFVGDGQEPVEGARVEFQVVNFSELISIYTGMTDADGKTELLSGLGDLYLHVHFQGKYAWKIVDLRTQEKEIHFDLSEFVEAEEDSYDFVLQPPEEVDVPNPDLTDEQKALHEEKIALGKKIREEYEATFISQEQGEALAKAICEDKAEQIATFLVNAKGNHEEILQFLQKEDRREDRIALLSTLLKKDFADSTTEVLEAHLDEALAYKGSVEDELFRTHILAPRISWEFISPWRKGIREFFSEEEKEAFRKNPSSIYDYIQEHIEDGTTIDYETIFASPDKLLSLGIGSRNSQEVLFVAICRSLGIPAKLDLADHSISYYVDGEKHSLSFVQKGEVEKTAKLSLRSEEQDGEYYKNFTLAKRTNGVYKTLGFHDVDAGKEFSFDLEAGQYRLLTSTRRGDGTIFATANFIALEKADEKEMELVFPIVEELREEKELPKSFLVSKDGNTFELLTDQEEAHAIAFLECGKEPTEHFFNEILEKIKDWTKVEERIAFVLQNESALENETLKKVLSNISPKMYFLASDDQTIAALKELSASEQVNLPFLLAIDAEGKYVFHSAGYNVSSADRLLKHLEG